MKIVKLEGRCNIVTPSFRFYTSYIKVVVLIVAVSTKREFLRVRVPYVLLSAMRHSFKGPSCLYS